MRRLPLLSVLAALLLGASGCTYFQDRGRDALDVFDLGVTFSKTPQFACYYDFVPILPIGYGKVDGNYFGLGDGRFSLDAPHFESSKGALLWGEEEVTFKYSRAELEALPEARRNEETAFQRTGLLGLFQGPFPGPRYLLSCPHYLHLGWVGLVATPRYLHMLDFILGWTTLDVCGDDGRGAREDADPQRP